MGELEEKLTEAVSEVVQLEAQSFCSFLCIALPAADIHAHGKFQRTRNTNDDQCLLENIDKPSADNPPLAASADSSS